MSGLDRKLFTYFSDIKFPEKSGQAVLISEISVQMESACGFKEIQKKGDKLPPFKNS